MPELPEVETVRRGLAPVMEGDMIAQAQVNKTITPFIRQQQVQVKY